MKITLLAALLLGTTVTTNVYAADAATHEENRPSVVSKVTSQLAYYSTQKLLYVANALFRFTSDNLAPKVAVSIDKDTPTDTDTKTHPLTPVHSDSEPSTRAASVASSTHDIADTDLQKQKGPITVEAFLNDPLGNSAGYKLSPQGRIAINSFQNALEAFSHNGNEETTAEDDEI